MRSNRIFIFVVFLSSVSLWQNGRAQGFYDLFTIQQIEVFFGYSNWDYRMDTAMSGAESYIMADSVRLNGTVFTQVGVKYKGNSSYNPNRPKNPLHIKLDEFVDQSFEGYEDIKLSNGFSDNSMIREVLSYALLRQYMEAPLCNFARVYINGNYYGIMSNAESIDKTFLLKRYFSDCHTFVKCNPQNAGPGSGNGSSLEYSGNTISSYNTRYELKSDTGWYELIALCDTLNNQFSSFDQLADTDRFLWMLAFNNVLVNLDSYSGSFRQNYYLYRNHARQWIPTIWDLNMSFGGFSIAGGTTSNLNPNSMQTMSYTLHQNETGWPLIYRLLNNPMTFKMYQAHMRTINQENFVNESYKLLGDSLHNLIDQAVQTDANYLSTYTNFQNALTSNTTGTGGGPSATSPGIYPLMDGRANYLSNVLSAAAPVIGPIQTGSGYQVGDTAHVQVSVSNAVAVYLGFRKQKQDRFKRMPMWDDGQHQDGAAGDGVYGIAMPLQSGETHYYIYAENSNTGSFSPPRAEFVFHTLNAQAATAGFGQLVLNEITANNTIGIQNEEGNCKDWIELVNKSNQPLSLSGLYLSDSPTDLSRWAFPPNAMIDAAAHVLIWADDLDETFVRMHTNFNLSNTGDGLYLSDGNQIFDSITFGSQNTNHSLSRCVDATGPFVINSNPTPEIVNDCSTAIDEKKMEPGMIYPNPATNKLYWSGEAPVSYEIIDLQGKVMQRGNENSLPVHSLEPGLYFCRLFLSNGVTVVRKFEKR